MFGMQFLLPVSGLGAKLFQNLPLECRVLPDAPNLVDYEFLNFACRYGFRWAGMPAQFLGILANIISILLVTLLRIGGRHGTLARGTEEKPF